MKANSVNPDEGAFLDAIEVTYLTHEEIMGANHVVQLALSRLESVGATDLPKTGDILGAMEAKYGHKS